MQWDQQTHVVKNMQEKTSADPHDCQGKEVRALHFSPGLMGPDFFMPLGLGFGPIFTS